MAFWLALKLFSSVLLPFVAAAGIAYVLDPPTSWLTRRRLSRGVATALIMLAFVTGFLVFLLLLYPLIISQVGVLIGRVPQYAGMVQVWAYQMISLAQERSATTSSTTNCVSWSAARPAPSSPSPSATPPGSSAAASRCSTS